ncbi:MAG: hydrogenase expression/formation protein HypE [bacterium]
MTDQFIQLGHGGGGRLSRDLIQREIVSRFGDGALKGLPDGATLPVPAGRFMVFTTDSFVVQPLEFPGGNIGDLAVHGTVNDLAVCGAIPRWLSLALILEEGLPLVTLRHVLDSVKRAADDCGVAVVTGDTKVVERGQCDGMYVNTAGIGERMDGFELGANRVVPGDHILVSGPVGDHGMAVLAAREGIRITHGVTSDTGPVHRLVQAVREFAPAIRFMRDPTRGGLAAVLNEVVEDRAMGILLNESDLPYSKGAKAAAELLGVDLLQVASEGRMILIADPSISEAVLKIWKSIPEGCGAARIGVVTDAKGRVVLETVTGGRRLVDVPRGELLPRIC